jgi:dihydrofolate reductase
MRKLKLQMQVSLDGFVAGPNGEMDWLTWNWDNKLNQYVQELTKPVDTIILGSVLAEGFIPVWKERAAQPDADTFTHQMVDTPKVVFSKTLTTHTWENTTLATGNIIEEVNKLKNAPGNDIVAYGGARFASALIKNNLIDEYHFFINPVATGKGLSIYNSLEEKIDLKLVKVTSFECGITGLCYNPARK